MNQQQPNPKNVQLSRSFKLSEFLSREDPQDLPAVFFPHLQRLAYSLQMLRDHVGRPVIITSGYRSVEHNTAVGGSPKSQHLVGNAADIKIPGIAPVVVAEIIQELIEGKFMKEGGIGIYDTWTHYDIRGTAARWDLRTKK